MKLYTTKQEKIDLLEKVIVIFFLLFAAVLFHPSFGQWRVQQQLFRLQTLLDDIEQPSFSMREFWQFREFYSPGTFSFNTDAIFLAGALQFLPSKAQSVSLLTFRSSKIDSEESILTESLASSVFANRKSSFQSAQVLFESNDTLVLKTADAKLHLYFLKKPSEFFQTVGFFDFGKVERQMLENKLWLDETTISL